MDALNNHVTAALETVVSYAEDVTCQIGQDTEKEILIITNDIGQKTVMNCALNSVGATIRQVCKHINNRTLFSYEEGYTIGC